MDRNIAVFAANLDRLLTLKGMRNAALARAVGTSRQMVSQWRQGLTLPDPEYDQVLAQTLDCEIEDLYTEIDEQTPPMLPIAQWAKRENIPIGRAKSLFDLGILTGSRGGAVGEMYLVPIDARAPADSKHLVRSARRPSWVEAFAINLDWRMRHADINNAVMGNHTGVGQCAVTHWRSGRGYPLEGRLPMIAALLGCTVEELIEKPTQDQVETWMMRYKRSPEVDMAFAVNFDWRIRLAKISHAAMAVQTGVTSSTVSHWRDGRGALPIDRLEAIADALDCTVDELLRDPTYSQIKEWAFRYERTDQDRAAA